MKGVFILSRDSIEAKRAQPGNAVCEKRGDVRGDFVQGGAEIGFLETGGKNGKWKKNDLS